MEPKRSWAHLFAKIEAIHIALTPVQPRIIKKLYTKGLHLNLRTRFRVFHRDNFTCRYCGRSAPNVVLQVDHVFPKSKGGQNTMDNFVAACVDCNQGKKDIILSVMNREKPLEQGIGTMLEQSQSSAFGNPMQILDFWS